MNLVLFIGIENTIPENIQYGRKKNYLNKFHFGKLEKRNDLRKTNVIHDLKKYLINKQTQKINKLINKSRFPRRMYELQ